MSRAAVAAATAASPRGTPCSRTNASVRCAQVGRRRRPHDVAQQRRRATQALELAGARFAAREVGGDGRGDRGVAGHQPRQPIGLDGRQLELFENLVVVHASPCCRVSDPARPSGPVPGIG